MMRVDRISVRSDEKLGPIYEEIRKLIHQRTFCLTDEDSIAIWGAVADYCDGRITGLQKGENNE